jgi:hypothetical protein
VSLIDDALKRAQAAGEGERGKPGDRPWTPTPMPDAGLARQRVLLRWLMVVAAACVVLAIAVIVVGYAGRQPPQLLSAGGRTEARAIPAPVATATPALAETVVAPPVAALARIRPTRAPRPAQDADTPAAVAPATPGAASRSAHAIVDGKNYVGSVTLPGGATVELGGIVWSETEPRALLNDRIVATGAYVEGFSVVKIEEGRVLLQKDGATISLSVK